MLLGRVPQEPQNTGAPPPPWENIDKTAESKTKGSFRFNLLEFMEQATGFGKAGTKIFLFGFAVALGFVSCIVYITLHQGPPPPPGVNRPALDQYASTTRLTLPR